MQQRPLVWLLHGALIVHLAAGLAVALALEMRGELAVAGPLVWPVPPPHERCPSRDPVPAPVLKMHATHWLATVKRHRVSAFTYGGDDDPLLVPNKDKPLPRGTPCLISVWPIEGKPNECNARVNCGAKELYNGGADCLLTSGGGGSRTDVVIQTRYGTCAWGTDLDIDTSGGTASVVDDNRSSGPPIETSRIALSIAGPGVTDTD